MNQSTFTFSAKDYFVTDTSAAFAANCWFGPRTRTVLVNGINAAVSQVLM
jgi:hypothetical protein